MCDDRLFWRFRREILNLSGSISRKKRLERENVPLFKLLFEWNSLWRAR